MQKGDRPLFAYRREQVMAQTLDITWYGQAMFSISSPGLTVVLDPTPPETGYSYEPFPADVVLMTHQHFDHGFVQGVTGNPRVITASGSFDLGGLKVEGFDSFHDAKKGSERGPNIIYTWEQAGIRLAHLGDLGDTPAPAVIKKLLKLDVVMMPVGGVYTIDAEQAVRLVRDIEPGIVLPMHYGTSQCAIPLEPVDEFTRRFGRTVRKVSERPVEVSTGAIPSSTEVWVLPFE
jgi:L-ascorbate metabolism protein UlaG (beta-lactamase superfamily)